MGCDVYILLLYRKKVYVTDEETDMLNGKTLHVLIIDDSEMNRKILNRY